MPPKSAKYLQDMLDRTRAIQRYADGKELDDFLRDSLLRDGITWNFCVIGEALSQLKQIDEATAERITDYWKIIGFRNQLIHGYGVIRDTVTWEIIHEKLPVLVKELEALLNE